MKRSKYLLYATIGEVCAFLAVMSFLWLAADIVVAAYSGYVLYGTIWLVPPMLPILCIVLFLVAMYVIDRKLQRPRQ